nr:RNA polymerase sigma-70 factor [Aquimarina sp. RZ0]
MKEIKNGNSQVFELIFKKYFKPLVAYAHSYISDIDIAQDLTQDIFLKLYEKRSTIEIHTSLKAFLYTSIRNRCFDYIKTNNIHKKHKDQLQIVSSLNNIDDEDPMLQRAELYVKIHEAIKSLPDQNQKIFKLSRLNGMTNQEIADELQISKRTVETHISNALKKIKSMVTLILILLIPKFFL